MRIPCPTIFYNPDAMKLVLTPEQQQFVSLLTEMDFDSAVKQMDLSLETIRKWFIDQKFRIFVRDIEDCTVDHVYHEVIVEAKRMMIEYRNLHSYMSIDQKADCLKSILSVMSAAYKGRPSIYRTTWAEDIIEEIVKQNQPEDEDDDEDYDDEYEDEDEDDAENEKDEPRGHVSHKSYMSHSSH